MKAVVCTGYGTPDVLQIRDVPVPVLQEHQMLIRIHASAVNSADIRIRSLDIGQPLKTLMRVIVGWKKPRKFILGNVFSGTVEKIGTKNQKFAVGDEVYGCSSGMNFGCHTEYIVLDSHSVVTLKPKNATHREAVSLIFGGTTALYFLSKVKNPLQKTLLVYGASGAVGSSAIQIAPLLGFRVTASASAKNEMLVKSLGVEQFLNYDQGQLSSNRERFDVVFDAVGKLSRKTKATLLTSKGTFLTVNSMDVAKETVQQLKQLSIWLDEGSLKAVIDTIYPLDEAKAAHHHVDTGHKKGNVVLSITENQ